VSSPEAFIGIADQKLARRLVDAFAVQGAQFSAFTDGATLWEHVVTGYPAVLVVDWDLRKVSGLEILFRTRQRPRSRRAIVALVVPDNVLKTYLETLTPSADCYIRPEDNAEKIIEDLWRPVRGEMASQLEMPVLWIGDLCLNPNSRRVVWKNREIHLSPDEFRLLQYLMENRGVVFSRADLVKNVWQGRRVLERYIDVVIGRIRNAIRSASGKVLIETIRGQGYTFP
jgi:DNA-binding response OmpR family regulator